MLHLLCSLCVIWFGSAVSKYLRNYMRDVAKAVELKINHLSAAAKSMSFFERSLCTYQQSSAGSQQLCVSVKHFIWAKIIVASSQLVSKYTKRWPVAEKKRKKFFSMLYLLKKGTNCVTTTKSVTLSVRSPSNGKTKQKWLQTKHLLLRTWEGWSSDTLPNSKLDIP